MVIFPLQWIPGSPQLWSAGGLQMLDIVARDVANAAPGDLYFAHLPTPHSPYVYDRSCNLRNPHDWVDRPDLVPRLDRYMLYLEQVECIRNRLQYAFNLWRRTKVFDHAKVITQGDHGSRLYLKEPTVDNRDELRESDYVDSFSTLLAVKSPGLEPKYDEQHRGNTGRAGGGCSRPAAGSTFWSSREALRLATEFGRVGDDAAADAGIRRHSCRVGDRGRRARTPQCCKELTGENGDHPTVPVAMRRARRGRLGRRRRSAGAGLGASGRSAGHHQRAHAPAAAVRRAERRPRGRSRDHLGARGSAGAHDGRVGDHRKLRRCAPGARPGGARGQRFHREGRSRRSAARRARVLPRGHGRSGRPQARERAGRGQLLDAACRAGATSASCGRAIPPGRAGGSTPTGAA